MKEIIVAIKDDTQSQIVERTTISHLSELGETVKDAVEDFTQSNGGVVMPPVTIQIHENGADEEGKEAEQAVKPAPPVNKS